MRIYVVAPPGECLPKRQILCCLQVILCDPYLSALEAFAKTRYIVQQIGEELWV